MSRPIAFPAGWVPAALVLLLWLCAGCSAGPISDASAVSATSQHPPTTGDVARVSASSRPGVPTVTSPAPSPAEPTIGGRPAVTTPTEPAPIRQGTVAGGGRVRFVPERIELPGGDGSVVESVRTEHGVLQVPADITHVGWWDGSAYAGDPFGATVIAGHVDSALQGLGFFAELLFVRVGDLVTLRSATNALTYRVSSATLVDKDALASDSGALDQRGPHRLVLITCSGQWHPEARSYDSNLVVVADPVVH